MELSSCTKRSLTQFDNWQNFKLRGNEFGRASGNGVWVRWRGISLEFNGLGICPSAAIVVCVAAEFTVDRPAAGQLRREAVLRPAEALIGQKNGTESKSGQMKHICEVDGS